MPRINEGLPNEQSRDSERELKIPKKVLDEKNLYADVIAMAGDELEVPAEKMQIELDFGNLENTILEFRKKIKFEDLPTGKELDEFLRFLENSKDVLERAIQDEGHREEALKCLEGLAKVTIDPEDYPEDSAEEAEALKRMADFGDSIYEIDREIGRAGRSLIEKLAPAIEKAEKEIPHSPDNRIVLDLYRGLTHNNEYGSRSTKLRMKGAELLAGHLPEIEKGLDNQDWRDYAGYVREIIYYGDDESNKEASETLARVLLTCGDPQEFTMILRLMLEYSRTSEDARMVIEAKLIEVGLPPFEVYDAWALSIKPADHVEAIVLNLKKIKELESTKQGCVKFLYDKFGIADFSRYPSAILLDMVENYENKEKPYGMIIFPRNDWNGAFYHNHDILKQLHDQLNGEFLLRIAECENKTDIAKTLVKLDKLYNPADGSGHRMSLLILGGHGQKDNIRFGGQDEKHSLHIEDLMGRGVKKTTKFFEANPTIILNSCSTGVESGIGQELSEMLGAKVIAPKIPTSLSGIYATKDDKGKFVFDAEYHEQDSKNSYAQGDLANKE